MGSIRLKKLSDNYRKVSTEMDKIDVFQSDVFVKKMSSRVRPSLVSIDIRKMRGMKRNSSLESPIMKGGESVLRRKYF